jgi:hypothetical protein
MTPRRRFRSPVTLPTKSFGVVTTTFMIGSSSSGLAAFTASMIASRPASSNATWLESTSW